MDPRAILLYFVTVEFGILGLRCIHYFPGQGDTIQECAYPFKSTCVKIRSNCSVCSKFKGMNGKYLACSLLLTTYVSLVL